MGDIKVSSAADFGMPSEVVNLPVPGPNGPLSIRIRALSVPEFMEYRARVTEAQEAGDGEAVGLDIMEWVAQAAVLEPQGLPWAQVHLKNREAILLEVMRLSMKGPGDGDALARFPADAERLAAGSGTASGGKSAGVPAA